MKFLYNKNNFIFFIRTKSLYFKDFVGKWPSFFVWHVTKRPPLVRRCRRVHHSWGGIVCGCFLMIWINLSFHIQRKHKSKCNVRLLCTRNILGVCVCVYGEGVCVCVCGGCVGCVWGVLGCGGVGGCVGVCWDVGVWGVCVCGCGWVVYVGGCVFVPAFKARTRINFFTFKVRNLARFPLDY